MLGSSFRDFLCLEDGLMLYHLEQMIQKKISVPDKILVINSLISCFSSAWEMVHQIIIIISFSHLVRVSIEKLAKFMPSHQPEDTNSSKMVTGSLPRICENLQCWVVKCGGCPEMSDMEQPKNVIWGHAS